MIFLDTSALVAFLDRDAERHDEVVRHASQLLAERRAVTHNYVLVETEALVRRRLGSAIARRLLLDVLPVVELEWVDADLHAAGVAALLRSPRRRASLVDHVSFEFMRRRRIESALALDRDFAREGFGLVPAG